ncbi:MAG TPA: TlpA disulfide reductase family protein [Magnetospirillum sp.]|jgi:thiol-disulfide isomerase/thioredoxin|nr:TlpA disulfide reductase family protein [Magnetospirillum sp.]
MNRRSLLATAAAFAALSPLPAFAVRAEEGLFVHKERRLVPALDVRDGESQPVTLQGPALVNLWASWCLPCVSELPALDRLAPQIEPEGVRVVALCLDRSGNVGAINTFARLGVRNLGVYVDYQRKAGEVLGAAVLPTTLLMDAQGREAARFIGPASWDAPEAIALLRALAAGRTLDPAMAPPLAKPRAAL